jgi:hypothetical protein
MTTERVKQLIAPLEQEKSARLSGDEITTFANLNDEEINFLAVYRTLKARTILHRIVLSGREFVDEPPISAAIQQQFFTNVGKLFAGMKHLTQEDAGKLTSKLLSNKNTQFVNQLVTESNTANLGWVFQHLPTIATYVDVDDRASRIQDLQERGLKAPSYAEIYLNSRRVSRLKKELESARSIRDNTASELGSARKKLHVSQKKNKSYKQERDNARKELAELIVQAAIYLQDKKDVEQQLKELTAKHARFLAEYEVDKINITHIKQQLEDVSLKLSKTERALEDSGVMDKDFAALNGYNTTLKQAQERLKADLQSALQNIRTVEIELTKSNAECFRLGQLNSQLITASAAVQLKQESTNTRLQQLPKVLSLFKIGMEGLNAICGETPETASTEPNPFTSSIESSARPSLFREENSFQTESGITSRASANGVFSAKKRKADEASLQSRQDDDKRSCIEGIRS